MNKLIKKLIDFRTEFHSEELKKGGKNSFYSYFELGDFIPRSIQLSKKHGIFPVISFGQELATMKIYSADTEETIEITSPMSSCSLKGCHPVQNLGSVETYIRRYLWLCLLEIVEHDKIEKQTAPNKEVEKKEVEKKPIKKATSLLDESIIAECKKNGVDSEALGKMVKDNFAKGYKELTTVEKNSLINLIKGVDNGK